MNLCGNIKVNDDEDKKLSMTNHNNNNNNSTPFENDEESNLTLFDKFLNLIMNL